MKLVGPVYWEGVTILVRVKGYVPLHVFHPGHRRGSAKVEGERVWVGLEERVVAPVAQAAGGSGGAGRAGAGGGVQTGVTSTHDSGHEFTSSASLAAENIGG